MTVKPKLFNKKNRTSWLFLGILILAVIIFFTQFALMKRQINSSKASGVATLFLNPSTITVPPAQQFTLDVLIDTAGTSVQIVTPQLTYDPTQVTLISLKPSTSFPQVVSDTFMATGSGQITLAPVSISQSVSGVAVVATATFVRTPLASGSTTIQFGSDSFVGTIASGTQNVLSTTKGTTVTLPVSPSPVSVDTTPPSVTITTPTDGSILKKGSLTIKASSFDLSDISRIEIFIDNDSVQVCAKAANCSYKFNTNSLSSGSHSIMAKAWDNSSLLNSATTTIQVTKQ